MLLWTIQDISVLNEVNKNGVYHTNTKYLFAPPDEDDDCNHANFAYKWLAKKLEEYVGPAPQGVEYPIWAMYKEQNQVDGKPDLRVWKYNPGQTVVRLKLDVPDYLVLISDFDMWHMCLNFSKCTETEAEFDEFHNRIKALGLDIFDIGNWSKQSPLLTQLRSEIIDSWDLIFKMRAKDETWVGDWKSRSFQAVFWELRKEYIMGIEKFPKK